MSRSLYLACLAPLASLLAVGCDDGTTHIAIPLYTSPVVDGGNAFQDSGKGHEAGRPSDAGHDTGREAGTPVDAGAEAARDATSSDAPAESAHEAGEAAAPDASPDVTTPDASPDVSVDAPLPPFDSGFVCLPDSGSCAPVCMHTGTATEGWYEPNGALICLVACASAPITCEHVGQTQQGWYSTSGHGCNGHATEVLNDHLCPQ